MSFSLVEDKKLFKVIVSKDSAVKCSDEEYQEYLKDLDESKLKLEGNPTRFVFKKQLSFAAHQLLMRSQARFEKGEISPDLSSIMEEVRLHWVDVENPADLPEIQHIKYKKADDGFASRELVAALQSFGVLLELKTAITHQIGTRQGDPKKS